MLTRNAAIAASLCVLLGLAIGVWLALRPGGADRYAVCREGAVSIGGVTIGGPFALTDHRGAAVTEAEVIDRPAILYFGYTFCPDICPVDAANIAEAADILGERGMKVRPVFVTIDPARDTPEALSDFVANLSSEMVGLTGDDAAIAAIAKAYRVYYNKAGDDPEDYLMDHSTYAYLVHPRDGFLDILRRDIGVQGIVEKTSCYLNAA